jgi:pimeloyl-ACP methyl ester carboxylesterase
MIRTRRFEGSEGNSLVADVAGPDDGLPVLLLHGGGQTRHSWRRALIDLAGQGYHALALDARGHGESAWPDSGDYQVSALCADLRCVMAALAQQRQPPVLVGASLGGVTAMITEGETPGLMRALVLVDVAPRIEPAGVERIFRFMQAQPEGFANLEEAADAVAQYNPDRPRPRDPAGLAKNLRQGADGRWRWHWDPRFMNGDRKLKTNAMQDRMLAAAQAVQVPVLLVRGQHSDIVSDAGVAELRQHLPHLQYVDVQGAGHMVAGDRNDHFNAAVLDFLVRHGQAAPARS